MEAMHNPSVENEVIGDNICVYEINEEPRIGMLFNTKEDVHDYYSKYAQRVGFGIIKQSQKFGDDGELRYFTLECSRGGKTRLKSEKPLKPILSVKTECKAKIRATLQPDQQFMLTTVVLEHNHDLNVGNVRHSRSNRKLDKNVKKRNDQAGISVCKNFNSLVEARGYDRLCFGEKDIARRLRLEVGDAEAIIKYFVKMHENSSNFFYAMDFDDESRIRNVFWADARSRAAYEEFGDVISFDTTYLTNKYDMPLALFLGVNHHGQSILLGCGLLSSEHCESFVWLFQSWLECMSGCPPQGIITDQCKAMQRAIEIVFPTVQYRCCLGYIMKNIPQKLRGYSQYEAIKSSLQKAVYDSLTIDDFEKEWKRCIEEYNLSDSKWLEGLYDDRHSWVPVYFKETFWAGMLTPQRSDNMTPFFDGYVTSKTPLKQFVEQYDKALRTKIEKEKDADIYSYNSMYDCLTAYDIEKQFQRLYTNAKFKEVQDEFKRMIYCRSSLVKEEDSISTYEVTEDVKLGDGLKRAIFIVYFNAIECEAQCTCHLFEFKGIICGHSLTVLTQRQVREVPPKFILSRWRKDLKREYTFIKLNHNDLGVGPNAQWFSKVCKEISDVAASAIDSEEMRNIVSSGIEEIRSKVRIHGTLIGSNQVASLSSEKCDDDCIEVSQESNHLLNPLADRRKGCPPFKRQASIVHELVQNPDQKTRKQTMQKGLQDEALLASHTQHVVAGIGTRDNLKAMISDIINL